MGAEVFGLYLYQERHEKWHFIGYHNIYYKLNELAVENFEWKCSAQGRLEPGTL